MPCAAARRATPATALPARVCSSSGALAGDDQVGAGQGRVEADEVEHDVDPRAPLGPEHGEQREPHPTGRPGPRLPGTIDQ